MSRLSPAAWVTSLRRIARPVADPEAPNPGVMPGAGALEAPIRAAVAGVTVQLPPEPETRGELGLWWARVDERIDVDAILSATPAGRGPLLPRDRYQAIEVWTDADLSALHALWWLARRRARADWVHRVEGARDWHLEHTQPDNATNRPWSLHVFLLAGRPECQHYAETLLHNCMAIEARPDPLSAWVLWDAARAIETTLAGR